MPRKTIGQLVEEVAAAEAAAAAAEAEVAKAMAKVKKAKAEAVEKENEHKALKRTAAAANRELMRAREERRIANENRE